MLLKILSLILIALLGAIPIGAELRDSGHEAGLSRKNWLLLGLCVAALLVGVADVVMDSREEARRGEEARVADERRRLDIIAAGQELVSLDVKLTVMNVPAELTRTFREARERINTLVEWHNSSTRSSNGVGPDDPVFASWDRQWLLYPWMQSVVRDSSDPHPRHVVAILRLDASGSVVLPIGAVFKRCDDVAAGIETYYDYHMLPLEETAWAHSTVDDGRRRPAAVKTSCSFSESALTVEYCFGPTQLAHALDRATSTARVNAALPDMLSIALLGWSYETHLPANPGNFATYLEEGVVSSPNPSSRIEITLVPNGQPSLAARYVLSCVGIGETSTHQPNDDVEIMPARVAVWRGGRVDKP